MLLGEKCGPFSLSIVSLVILGDIVLWGEQCGPLSSLYCPSHLSERLGTHHALNFENLFNFSWKFSYKYLFESQCDRVPSRSRTRALHKTYIQVNSIIRNCCKMISN